MVTGPTSLSPEEMNNFSSYKLNTRKSIQELIALIQNATREMHISDTLGCKSQIQAEELIHRQQSHDQSWQLCEQSLRLWEKSPFLREALKLCEQSLDLRERSIEVSQNAAELGRKPASEHNGQQQYSGFGF